LLAQLTPKYADIPVVIETPGETGHDRVVAVTATTGTSIDVAGQ
jgi:hypothetical protein